jgi:cytochrome c553
VNGKIRIVFLTVVVLAVASAVSVSSAPLRKSASRELALPDHVRPIIGRACLDCHTDQTQWPWYSRLPGIATLIERDVKKGREHLNFSTWVASPTHKPTANQLQEVCDAVSDRAMPPPAYRLMHPQARLSPQDINALCDWADASGSLSESGAGGP